MSPRRTPWSAVTRRVGRAAWAPVAARRLAPLADTVAQVTRGRVCLLGLLGVPHLVLTVPRRRSAPVVVRLVHAPYGEEFLVAGGDDGTSVDHRPRPPAWLTALRATPTAEVTVRGRTVPVRVRVVQGADRARLWPLLVEVWPGYADCDARACEQWDVVLLTPA